MSIFRNYLERLLQANTDADSAQSGASVLADSYFYAKPRTSAPVYDISDGNSTIPWDTPLIVGADLRLNPSDAQAIEILTAGDYSVFFAMGFDSTTLANHPQGGMAGAGVWLSTDNPIAMMDPSYVEGPLQRGGDGGANNMVLSLTLPPVRLAAGEWITASGWVYGGGATFRADMTSIYVKRTS